MNKRKPCLFLVLFLVFACTVCPQSDPITNAAGRPGVELNGDWRYIVDPYENGYYNYRYEPFDRQTDPGTAAYFSDAKPADKTDRVEYDFDASDTIRVPGDWNSQKEKLFYYEGTVWYRKLFDHNKSAPDNRLFLYFGAVNYEAEVYLNGRKLGRHVGGFTPFSFEVTDYVRAGANSLVVKVDNKRRREAVPTLNTDWWNYGGITRGVRLIETPATFIREYSIQLAKGDRGRVSGFVRLDGPDSADAAVTLSIGDRTVLKEIRTDQRGFVVFETDANGLGLWSPTDPKLHEVSIIIGKDAVREKIGFRTVEATGGEILINNTATFLRGISIHEENPIRGGRAFSEQDARLLLGWAKELGCNFVRLAHYPHNEYMVRVADEMGMLVWEEIPVYWTIDWENPETFRNASRQLSELIRRDLNRASVIIWSIANETPVSEPRNRFLSGLAELARGLDDTRLISAALEQNSVEGDVDTRTISDPFAEKVDVLSFNQYIGWYDGLPSKLRQVNWKITQDKPVIISEFGAGAKQGFHADRETRWSEEFQEYLYEETVRAVEKIENLSGMSPWILVDFRSPRRHLPEIQDEWNRKGLISSEGNKKKAFFILQKYYRKKQEEEVR